MGLNEEPPKADDKATKVEEDDSEEEVEADEEEVDFDEDGKTILSCHVTMSRHYFFSSLSSFRCAIRPIKFRSGCFRRTK